jgi:hypothetical protein
MLKPFIAAVALLGHAHAAGVSGKAFGYATGTTGGGDAEAAAPSDISQLTAWLTDDTPRTILIDREFNYLGSAGKCNDCTCCIPDSNTCGSAGQNAIDTDSMDWCGDYPRTTCSYDKAALEKIDVRSNKSIVGVGSKGVIRGKGLRMVGGVSNIIIQNVHFTELNPQYIWGGDAITLDGTNNIWIDHVKVSLVGRQMFVSGFEASEYSGVHSPAYIRLPILTATRRPCYHLQLRVRRPDQLVSQLRRPPLLDCVCNPLHQHTQSLLTYPQPGLRQRRPSDLHRQLHPPHIGPVP